MDEESALALEAGPEPIDTQDEDQQVETEEQAEGQPEEATDDTEEGEKKSAAKLRRERAKAATEALRTERDEALAAKRAAEERLAKIESLTKAEPEPRVEQFDDYTDFVAAKATWAARQSFAQMNATQAQEVATAAQARVAQIDDLDARLLAANWQDQAKAAEARYADFKEVVMKEGLFPQGASFVPMVQQSDVAADLAYHIAQDVELHNRLARMSPIEAAREIGRVEARLSIPKPRTSTNAPAPISPVRGGANPAPNVDKMSMSDYVAARKAGKIK